MLTEYEIEAILDFDYFVDRKGYAIIYAPDCPYAWSNGQLRRHRYMAWRAGILVDVKQTVHHKNEIKLDDHPGNLEILTAAEHNKHHGENFSDQRRRRISEALRGKPKSVETRARIANTLQGNSNRRGTSTSPEGLANMRVFYAKRREQYWATNRELVDRVLDLRKNTKLTLLQIGALVGRSDRRVYEILKMFGG